MKKFQLSLSCYVMPSLLLALLVGVHPSAFSADKLTVRAGQNGYLGELYPSSRTANLNTHARYVSTSSYPLTQPDVNYPMLPHRDTYLKFATISSNIIGSNFPTYNGAPGIRLINENDNSRIIILLLNGTVTASYKNSSYLTVTKNAVLKESRQISGQLKSSGHLSWGLEYSSTNINNYFQAGGTPTGFIRADITSFSAYSSSQSGGPTTVAKGRYKLSTGERLVFGQGTIYSYMGWSSSETSLLNDNTLSIEALDSCTVAPLTATNIIFGTQFSGYKQNQLLETRPATMAINCVTTGKLLMVLSANQPLHGQTSAGTTSGTNLAGMALDAVSGNSNNSTERPYIVTTKVPPPSDICRNGNASALVYYDRIKLGDITTTNLQQNLYFNLCHNGTVRPGGYRGSVDVSFYLE
ncbi:MULTISPECIES: hypothetical protein [Providencia]|uniref:Fimbrial-type adhesion domain-containing protein n=1 Tax=Providencia heimbachae ATCC 35613 TaxID=1354272 RepID=A0A1B7JMH0_9GAMM|nr:MULTISPECIES: hypothetical protein [Providencia]MBP6122109.1 hypothetical protein [Providencia sp.]NIH21698.1 hypothetical protein [Providencia heimbachae]OAT49111.1 hypothetical protein M998_3087 [Providencia heimbachae ATCC 35613]SQH12309.1 Uncharacterised protein [Providencia heimbachae]